MGAAWEPAAAEAGGAGQPCSIACPPGPRQFRFSSACSARLVIRMPATSPQELPWREQDDLSGIAMCSDQGATIFASLLFQSSGWGSMEMMRGKLFST